MADGLVRNHIQIFGPTPRPPRIIPGAVHTERWGYRVIWRLKEYALERGKDIYLVRESGVRRSWTMFLNFREVKR